MVSDSQEITDCFQQGVQTGKIAAVIHPMSSTTVKKDPFATTRWSLVMDARTLDQRRQSQALEELCKIYWKPIYGYVRSKSANNHDAEDLTQQFFLHLLSKNTLDHADKGSGRFRAYLITCAKNFIYKQNRDKNRLKRGGGKTFIPYDFTVENSLLDSDPYKDYDPDKLFGKKWAETVIERSLSRLRTEWELQGKPFEKLVTFINSPKGSLSYQGVADELGISLPALKSAVFRMRTRFGDIVRSEVSETVDSEDELEDELRLLLEYLE